MPSDATVGQRGEKAFKITITAKLFLTFTSYNKIAIIVMYDYNKKKTPLIRLVKFWHFLYNVVKSFLGLSFFVRRKIHIIISHFRLFAVLEKVNQF